MFDLGEKVILLASSCHKKTGPRKNSIGYITVFNSTLKVVNGLNLITMGAEIRFLRYGNEKKDRFETKRVRLVFPILQNNFDIRLDSFIHAVNKPSDKMCSVLSIFENKPIVLAVPFYTPGTNLSMCSDQEFSCWLESCIMSQQINFFINQALISYHFFQNKEIDPSQLIILQNAMVSNYTRKALIEDICRNASRRIKWINILRLIIVTSGYIRQKDISDNLFSISRNRSYKKDIKGRISRNGLYSILGPHIFYSTFHKFENIFKGSNQFKLLVKELNTTKTIMLSLPTKKGK